MLEMMRQRDVKMITVTTSASGQPG